MSIFRDSSEPFVPPITSTYFCAASTGEQKTVWRTSLLGQRMKMGYSEAEHRPDFLEPYTIVLEQILHTRNGGHLVSAVSQLKMQLFELCIHSLSYGPKERVSLVVLIDDIESFKAIRSIVEEVLQHGRINGTLEFRQGLPCRTDLPM
jgi:hypothetical protein